MNKLKITIIGCAISSASLVCGYLVGKINERKRIAKKTKYAGNLRIDNSEGEEMMFLEVTNYSALEDSEIIQFKVIRENYIVH